MDGFLRIKDKCKELYADYDIVIRPVLKFGLAVLSFLVINNELGYLSALNNLFVLMILAVICAILPLNGIVLIGTLLIVAHCFGLGIEVGGFALVLYLLMMLLYFRFVPKDALAMLLTPVAYFCHIPPVVPMSLGQIRGPISALSVVFGIVSWQFVRSVPEVIEPLKSAPDVSLLDVLQAMPNMLITKEMVFEIIIAVVVMLIVVSIRRLGGNHSYEKAIVAGAIVYLVLQLFGGRILGVEVNPGSVIIATIGSLLISYFLMLFYFSADYKASENVEFEDDRYYYRVRVIPKLRPVDSRTGEVLELEHDEEMPEVNTERFRQLREEEIENKFRGINLQSKLEQSLRELDAKTSPVPTEQVNETASAEALKDTQVVYSEIGQETRVVPTEDVQETKVIPDEGFRNEDSPDEGFLDEGLVPEDRDAIVPETLLDEDVIKTELWENKKGQND